MSTLSAKQIIEKYAKLNSSNILLDKQFYSFNIDDNLEFNIENIFNEITISTFKESKNIIVIGEVQSGKTNNLIRITDKLINSNQYEHIIWLSGTNKNLARQTFNRYTDTTNLEFYNSDIFFYESDTHKNSKDLLLNALSSNKKVISLVLKQPSHLKDFLESLKISSLIGKKMIIIDDECDYFSISNLKKENVNKVTIREMIENMLNNFKYSKTLYLGITATPYSNFSRKKTGKLFPEKLILLNTNYDEYTGLNWFNSKKQKVYIKTLDTKNTKERKHSLKLSLINLIYSYLIRVKQNKYSELLINIDLINEEHEIIFDSIKVILENWESDISFGYEKLKDEINIFLKELNYEQNVDIDLIISCIKKFKDIFKIQILNSSIMDENHIQKYESNKYNAVIIGGVMISRGFTFENLTTELMINAPAKKSRIDILLQRARWFGYRRSSENYIRVIMNNNIITAFEEAEKVQIVMMNKFKNSWIIDEVDSLYNELKTLERELTCLEVD